MTADQLLEKLERLEMLQQTQSQKEGEVKAIDRSADSEEVKKALQKNPDISKERNNLLKGKDVILLSYNLKNLTGKSFTF